jgi:hypothetical protein
LTLQHQVINARSESIILYIVCAGNEDNISIGFASFLIVIMTTHEYITFILHPESPAPAAADAEEAKRNDDTSSPSTQNLITTEELPAGNPSKICLITKLTVGRDATVCR